MVEYREALKNLDLGAAAEKKAFEESFRNTHFTGLADRVEMYAGDSDISQADFHVDVETPLLLVQQKGMDMVRAAKVAGYDDNQLVQLYRHIDRTIERALRPVQTTLVERPGSAARATVGQLELGTLVENYIRFLLEAEEKSNAIPPQSYEDLVPQVNALSAQPALLFAPDFAHTLNLMKVHHPELLRTADDPVNGTLSPEDLVDLKVLLPDQKSDWLSEKALIVLNKKIHPRESVVAGSNPPQIAFEKATRLSPAQEGNLNELNSTLVSLLATAETNDQVYVQRGLTHFGAHPDRPQQIVDVINPILQENELSKSENQNDDPKTADWKIFVEDIRVEGLTVAELQKRLSGGNFKPDDVITFRKLTRVLQQQKDLLEIIRGDLGATTAEQDAQYKDRSDWINQLVEQATAASRTAETGYDPESTQPKLYHQFLEKYGIDKNGKPLSPDIIYGKTELADEERHRATLRWMVNLWQQIASHPSPFLGMDLLQYDLSELGHSRKLINIAESVPPGVPLYRFFFGTLKVYSIASKLYANQVNHEKLISIYEENPSQLQMLEFILRTGKMGTGDLTMGKYVQYALQAIVMHNPVAREMYRPALDEHLNKPVPGAPANEPHPLDKLFPDETEAPKYMGQTIDDLLVQEEAKNSANALRTMIEELAKYIQAEDAIHGKADNPLSIEDARFVVDTAINTAEYLQIIAGLDNKKYVSKRFMTRLKFLKQYRTSKFKGKQLGSIRSIPFFRTLQPEISQMITGEGVDLENIIMLTGTVDNNPNLQERFKMEHPVDKDGKVLLDKKLVTENLDLRKGPWNFPQEVGKLYVRMNGFTKKFYDLITGKEQLAKDWFSGSLADDQALRSVHNDKVGYYFGDLEKNAPKQAKNQTDEEYFNDHKVERQLWANKGYLLVKGYKLDPNMPGHYIGKDGTSTPTMKEADSEWRYTPAPVFFDLFPGIEPTALIDMSIDRPNEFQELMLKGYTADTFTKIRLEFTKWLIINEIAQKAHDFQHKELTEKKKILDNFFACMCQDVYSARYLESPMQVFTGDSDHVETAGFGLYTVDDVIDILDKSEWIRPIDVQLKLYIATKIKPTAARVKWSGIRPRVH